MLQPAAAWEQDGAYRFSDVDRLVVVGDVHGALTEFRAVLREAGIIDADDQWIAGNGHLVSVGDLLDRGDDSRAAMDLVRSLMTQAETAGGRVHMVLGNHEIMNMTGDLAYVTPGEFESYVEFAPAPAPAEATESPTEAAGEGENETGAGEAAVASEPPGRIGHRFAFSPEGPYGAWLLSLPFAIVVNDHLFVHGGVSTLLEGMTLEELNSRAHGDLRALLSARERLIALGLMPVTADNGDAQDVSLRIRDAAEALPEQEDALEIPTEHKAAAEAFLLAIDGLPIHPQGPNWNRRNAVCHRLYYESVTERILEQFGARYLVIGHTPTIGRTIQSRFSDQVVLVDTGMNVGYYKGHPSAMVIEDGSSQAIYTDLPAAPVERMAPRMWERPYGMSDAELERFLSEAEIVHSEVIPTGITKPERLTLSMDGKEIRAVFKYFDSDPDLGPERWSHRRGRIADRYINELVAYQIDRLLGFHMVPPAVLREVEGREGIVQYWIEKAINERDRRERGVPYRGYCAQGDQYGVMNVFDALIHNTDRNLTNILFTYTDWKLWLVDHGRSFSSDRRLPDYLREAPFKLTPELRELLEGLDEESLAPLRTWLHEKQIEAIVRRAKQVLKNAR